jgi:hypothetical protein
MNKKELSERDICTKFITPALRKAGWDELSQLREEVSFTNGRIIVRGKMVTRGKAKRADYILYYKPNIPLAVIEAKDNNCHMGDGLQQALEYAGMLQLPFVFASNGDGFVFHDRTRQGGEIERTLPLEGFPSPDELWNRYREWKGLPSESEPLVLQDYYSDGEKGPRYYQAGAVNAAVEAIAKGQNRLLLVMATGTGKTYTAFQIIWRLWRARRRKRILYLADRNVLINQTMVNDFRPFGSAHRDHRGRSDESRACGSRAFRRVRQPARCSGAPDGRERVRLDSAVPDGQFSRARHACRTCIRSWQTWPEPRNDSYSAHSVAPSWGARADPLEGTNSNERMRPSRGPARGRPHRSGGAARSHAARGTRRWERRPVGIDRIGIDGNGTAVPAPENAKIYHIIHVDRLPSVLADGCLWPDAEMANRPGTGTVIGMNDIKRRRLEELTLASHPGLYVGRCVPFYFCPRSVMLYLIGQANHPSLGYRHGEGPIVHLEADLHATVRWAERTGCRWAFTLSNAGARYFEDRNSLDALHEIDWDAVAATRWSGAGIPGSVKDGKQAEFLLERSFPWTLVERIGIKSAAVAQQVAAALRGHRHRPIVEVRKDWYYGG